VCYNTIVPRERRHELGTMEVFVPSIFLRIPKKIEQDDLLGIMLPPNHFSNTEKVDKAGKVLLLLD
jgi:hypothetical protein